MAGSLDREVLKSSAMLVIRTDFSDQHRWQAVRAAIEGPGESEYVYPPEFWDRKAYEDVPVEGILSRLPKAIEDPFVAVVDHTTITSAEMPILLVNLRRSHGRYGRTFRVVPNKLPSIEVNVSLGNLSFTEFADHADSGGIFHGFPSSS
jgi:hypothetical protein